ncbi:hypothetical protein OL548_32840 [Lysinibacillus sp. MHQ-1]|nr:hypothetical protein OL548_32840 [Lysinibacillus sp. MHQ-1]
MSLLWCPPSHFLSVGVLATMSSYTTQYDRLNPLGLVYKGDIDNPYEREHINSLRLQLEEKGLSYQLSRFVVIKQTSSFTQNEVEVFRESDMNVLLSSYSYPLLDLGSGEAVFIPYSEDSLKKIKKIELCIRCLKRIQYLLRLIVSIQRLCFLVQL